METFTNTDFSLRQYKMSKLELGIHKMVNDVIYYRFHRNEEYRAWVDRESYEQYD